MRAEVRAAIAIAKKDLKTFFRYRIAVVSQIFVPLYQGVIPGLLFGASFAVGGRVVGLEATVGTENLAGFIFMGGVMSGLIATGFWSMAMGIRNEMDAGTLEPSWLTPTHHETLLIGRALGGVVWQVIGQTALFAIGIGFFGLRFRMEILYAVPAVLVAVVAMVGVAFLLAAGVVLIREANFFIDTTNFLFSIASGTAFPVTILPAIFLPSTPSDSGRCSIRCSNGPPCWRRPRSPSSSGDGRSRGPCVGCASGERSRSTRRGPLG